MLFWKRKDSDPIEEAVDTRHPKRRHWVYPLCACIWLVALFWVAGNALGISASGLFFWAVPLALPMALLSAQRAHVRRSDGLRHWRQGSRWHKFWAGASWRLGLSWTLSIILIFGLLVHVAIEPNLRAPIVGTAVVLPICLWLMSSFLLSSLKAPWFSFAPVGFGIVLTVSIVLAVRLIFGSEPSDIPATLEAARAQYPCYSGDSALLDVIFEFTTFSAAIVNYGFALAQLAYPNWGTVLYWTAVLLETGLLVIVAYSLAAFLLPKPQLRLGLRSVGEDPDMPKDPSRRLLVQQTAVVAAVGITGHWVIGEAENFAVKEKVPLLLRSGTMVVEQIDGGYYQDGTIAFLEKFEGRAQALVNSAVEVADREIALAFQVARGRVDTYLNWHFSLKAEAARVIGLENIASGLQNKLGLGRLNQKAEIAIARLDGATRGLSVIDALISDILKTQKIQKNAQRSRHVVTAKRAELAPTLRTFLDPIPFKARIGVSGASVVAGGLSGAFLGRYIGRQAVARGGGIIIGSGLGSALPLAGTAVGALFGLVLGTIADWGMLKYNERTLRSRMRSELIAKLNGEEQKLRKALASLRPKLTKPFKPQIEPRCKSEIADA